MMLSEQFVYKKVLLEGSKNALLLVKYIYIYIYIYIYTQYGYGENKHHFILNSVLVSCFYEIEVNI